MKRFAAILFVLFLSLGASALVQISGPAARPLTEWIPSGPLLVLEAGNFASLVGDWDSSKEKRLWLDSDNFQVFSRSRLFLRLEKVQKEFAAAAGVPPDMALVKAVAGSESVVALYDIGKLEFLYITRMPLARAQQTLLWQTRGQYETRKAAGQTYFVRLEEKSKRAVAFAATDEYLLLATRETLLADCLKLIAGRKDSGAVTGEPWYSRSVSAAERAGDLRLVLNLEAVLKTPHFRSYWIQKNVAALRPYVAEISDLHVGTGEFREERILFRAPAGNISTAESEKGAGLTQGAGLEKVLPLIPAEAGFYQAWEAPKTEDVLRLLELKLLAPRPEGTVLRQTTAPRVATTRGTVRSAADLETKIDRAPPKIISTGFSPQPLQSLLDKTGLRAALQIQSSRAVVENTFVKQESGVVLLGSADWDSGAARSALLTAIEGLWTTSRLGAAWTEKSTRTTKTYFSLDGLTPLYVAVEGPFLVLADGQETMNLLLDKLAAATAAGKIEAGQGQIYAAGFAHARERPHFAKMMRMIDFPRIRTSRPRSSQRNRGRTPLFFSENLGSLSRTLGRVREMSISVREQDDTVRQTVRYKLTP